MKTDIPLITGGRKTILFMDGKKEEHHSPFGALMSAFNAGHRQVRDHNQIPNKWVWNEEEETWNLRRI